MMTIRKLLAAAIAAATLGAASGPSIAQDDPLLRPILPADAAKWLGAQAPLRIYGNSYLVGFQGLNVGLIRTGAGLILIDGAVPQGVRAIEANIRQRGFRVRDVKLILTTEGHFDHASGIAALARDTGATVIASWPTADVLRRGQPAVDDPQIAYGVAFPAVARVRGVTDGAQIRLGATVVTARATPGHTPGSMSWTWRACEGAKCRAMVFASSLNPIGGPGYRYSAPGHARAVIDFRRSFAIMRALPCDVLLTAHPDQSSGDSKARALAAGRTPNPFIDPAACRTYAAKYATLFDQRLVHERSGKVH